MGGWSGTFWSARLEEEPSFDQDLALVRACTCQSVFVPLNFESNCTGTFKEDRGIRPVYMYTVDNIEANNYRKITYSSDTNFIFADSLLCMTLLRDLVGITSESYLLPSDFSLFIQKERNKVLMIVSIILIKKNIEYSNSLLR